MSQHADLEVRPIKREPVHGSITQQQISDLVEQFYADIRQDARLGPIFAARIAKSSNGNWQPHLTKMKKFWASVLLKTGEYKGQPVIVHNGLGELHKDDFAHWLKLFANTVKKVLEPDAQKLVFAAAHRIAQSLYLARFGGVGTTPPF